MSDFRDFLDGQSPPGGQLRYIPRCSICSNPVLAKEVLEYTTGRLDGSISLKIHAIWAQYFGPVRGVGSPQTVRTHIRMHLGILDL